MKHIDRIRLSLQSSPPELLVRSSMMKRHFYSWQKLLVISLSLSTSRPRLRVLNYFLMIAVRDSASDVTYNRVSSETSRR